MDEKDDKPLEIVKESKNRASAEDMQRGIDRSIEVNTAKKLLRKYTPNSEWDLSQQIIQEILAYKVIQDPSRKYIWDPKFQKEYQAVVEQKYHNDPELQKLLLICTPSHVTLGKWVKKTGWDEAVWAIVKEAGMFTKEKRATMIDSLYKRGLEKDTVAAKIWLTLSGDYSDKMEVKDETADKYREINKVLHGKKD